MIPRRTLLALTLCLLAGNAAAQLSPARNGALPTPANSIVGLWQINATTGPCTGGPTRSFIAAHAYHAGGTLSDAGRVPPTSRGPGQGIWDYRGRGHYKTRFQFNRFLPDGSFDGVQDIRNDLILSAAGSAYSATIYTRVLNPDGSLRSELCGAANGERIPVN